MNKCTRIELKKTVHRQFMIVYNSIFKNYYLFAKSVVGYFRTKRLNKFITRIKLYKLLMLKNLKKKGMKWIALPTDQSMHSKSHCYGGDEFNVEKRVWKKKISEFNWRDAWKKINRKRGRLRGYVYWSRKNVEKNIIKFLYSDTS